MAPAGCYRIAAVAAAIATCAGPAHGYRFAVRATTVGQALTLRTVLPLSGDIDRTRRRFTQSLHLTIWNLLDRQVDWSGYGKRHRGLKLSVHSSLRIDHGFGDWTTGQAGMGTERGDAIDYIAELEEGAIALDVLQLYFAAEDIVPDRVDAFAGRLLQVGGLEWWSVDGAEIRVHPTPRSTLSAVAGLRTRSSSWVASSVTELDGISSGSCLEYVEGAVPGSGSWRPIDIGVTADNPFRNDLDRCPMRNQLQPTFAVAAETAPAQWFHGRLSYRRAASRTPGAIGPTDRFDHPDTGYYPNEVGQAPGWGVNEEFITAIARGNFESEGWGALRPYAEARYSLAHGVVDQLHLGARASRHRHSLEPELYYSFPVFDADSIFNVFNIHPYWDMRVTYEGAWAGGDWAASAMPWARRFETDEPGRWEDWAAGAQIGVRRSWRRTHQARIDTFWEDGYGGRRIGATGSIRVQTTADLDFDGRLVVFDYRVDDESDDLQLGAQLGSTYQVFSGVGTRFFAEYNHGNRMDHQVRLLAILDLAFSPDL